MVFAVNRYIVVVGGSYVGNNTAQQLAHQFAGHFRVILVEKNSHFNHLFAFPRFAVTLDVDTHKAFIPYTGTFATCPPGSGTVVQARVLSIDGSTIQLDRKVLVDNESLDRIPFEFLVVATGTKLTHPSTLPSSGKVDGTNYLRNHAQQVRKSSNIVILGGGAVGVQMATDIKELSPEKSVTLVHSRQQLMNQFDARLSAIIVARCEQLGIKLKLGSRAKIPPQGFPTDGRSFDVDLADGSSVPADFVIACTGQTPNSEIIKSISPDSVGSGGYIKVLKSLQLSDTQYPNIFAIGDVAATGACKAAKPALKQTSVVVANIQRMLDNEPLETYEVTDPFGIHLTLGITESVAFGNPRLGETDIFTHHKNDGSLDMNIDRIWVRRNAGTNYNL